MRLSQLDSVIDNQSQLITCRPMCRTSSGTTPLCSLSKCWSVIAIDYGADDSVVC